MPDTPSYTGNLDAGPQRTLRERVEFDGQLDQSARTSTTEVFGAWTDTASVDAVDLVVLAGDWTSGTVTVKVYEVDADSAPATTVTGTAVPSARFIGSTGNSYALTSETTDDAWLLRSIFTTDRWVRVGIVAGASSNAIVGAGFLLSHVRSAPV